MVLKRFGVLSVGKFMAVMYAIIGLIFGVLIAAMSLIGGGMFGGDGGAMGMMGGFGMLSIVVLPLLYAIIGFIAGLIGGFLFNVTAKLSGGIEMDLA